MPVRYVKKNSTTATNSFSFTKILEATKQEATGAKTSSYIITTTITGLFYGLITLLIIPLVPDYLQLAMWLMLSFLFALSFSPIRYGMEEFIRQLFPSSDYDSHQLVKYLNTISYSSLTLDALSQLFFEAFAARFDVPESAFIFFPMKQSPLIKTSEHFQNILALSQEEIETLTKNLIPEPIPVHHFKNEAAQKIIRSNHIKIVIPLTNNTKLVGLLFLGSKYSQKHYTTKDLKVLIAIAPKIGFAIKNAFEYERVFGKNVELISELQEANQKLRSANRQLRHDDKIKDEFAYVATHEMKNPITAMRGYLSLLMEGHFGPVPEKFLSPLKQIDASNQQLIGLLNNLLQIARSEATRLEIHTTPVIMCDVIDSVIKDLTPLIEQKGLKTEHSCKNRAISVMADRERLREIISNLLSNAIKYSDKGTISITHDIVQDKLTTHVADEGVGISADDQTKMFTRFFRVEEEVSKGVPGTGLGLFIVKQLLEKMNGRIWFKSELGVGSTFSFSLPVSHTYTLKSAQ